MSKHRYDSIGFSTIEILLALILVAIVAFTGVYIASNRDSKPATAKVPTVKTPTKVATVADPIASWTPYASTSGKFSIKYPTTWVVATHPELCSDGIFLLGADSNSVGKCGTDGGGQITITWRADSPTCDALNASDTWSQDSKEIVTVSGVNGTKITTTAKAPGFGVGSLPQGTKTTQYCFTTNAITYVADYNQLSSYPDVSSDFNTMVTKTLKFN